MKRSTRRRVLAFLAVAAVTLSAQDSPQTIRTTTRLVQVDVVAVDRNGEPVTDLTSDDFVLREEGKPQPIRVFSVVSSTGAPAAPKPLPRFTFSNRSEHKAGPPAVTIILFDALNTRFTDRAYAREQVSKVLQNLRSNDRVALYGLANELRLLQDFTADAAPLQAALASYGGMDSREQRTTELADPASTTGLRLLDDWLRDMTQVAREVYLYERTERTLSALETLAHHVAGLPGRKNLVWISSAFPISVGGLGSSFANAPPVPTSGLQDGRPSEYAPAYPTDHLFRRAARSLNDANVAVYPVDARGMIGPFDAPPTGPMGITRQNVPINRTADGGATFTGSTGTLATSIDPIEVMRNVAEDTGGIAFYNTNDITRAVRRAIDDTRVTYVLGFYPVFDKWDGRYRRIKVSVSRPGITLRYRNGYFASAEPVRNEKERQAVAKEIAWSPLEATAIGVNARFRRPLNPPDTIRLSLGIDPSGLSLHSTKGRFTGAVDVLLVLRSSQGKALWSDFTSVDMNLTDRTHKALFREGLRLDRTLHLVPASHELRIIVRDITSGAVGSLHIPVSAMVEADAHAR
jgi:VWFA-related protein